MADHTTPARVELTADTVTSFELVDAAKFTWLRVSNLAAAVVSISADGTDPVKAGDGFLHVEPGQTKLFPLSVFEADAEMITGSTGSVDVDLC